ncbi:MAG: DUF559 domain-containing protein, partial [Gammaproteobacteria bacterium]|nr:DUF559 domain-containing protein [Gammaproteobacteria bacterium]
DGATHSSDDEIACDKARTAFIKRQGWIVLRYWNQDVYEDLGGVLDAIYGAARDSQSCMRSLHAPAADDSSTPSSRPPSLGHSAAASPAIGGG